MRQTPAPMVCTLQETKCLYRKGDTKVRVLPVAIIVILALILGGCAVPKKTHKPPTADDNTYIETIRVFNLLRYPVKIMRHSGDMVLAPGVSTEMYVVVDSPHDTQMLKAYVLDSAGHIIIGTTRTEFFTFSEFTRGKKRHVWYIKSFMRTM